MGAEARGARFRGAWARRPDPIAESDAEASYAADVVVCGAGIAGVACAYRAAQLGASVIVIEKSGSWSARGGNIGVANSAFMKAAGFENDLAEVAREWVKRCMGRCDERILWQYLNNGARVMDWIVELVTRPEYHCRPALQGCLYKGETYKEIVGSHRFFGGAMEAKGMRAGAADVVHAMYTESLALGARYFFGTPAVQLLQQGGRVDGVFAQDAGGRTLLFKARSGTVLATGDIGGDDAMCDDLAPMANRAMKLYMPKGCNTGDGHRMAWHAGGAFEDLPFPTILHPQAYHYSNFCFLHVTPEGRRYYNEDSFVQGKSVAIMREGFRHAWAICDSGWERKVPMTLPYGGGIFWGHDCEVGGSPFDARLERESLERGLANGNVVASETPEGLAAKMGVPEAEFARTFARYREMTDAGVDADFGKRRELLVPIDEPPYYAMKFGPALLAVVGGLKVDCRMNVLDDAGRPIIGLFAAGNTAGGRYGVDYPILIPGNSNGTAAVFGFLLGETLGQGLAPEGGMGP